MVSGAIQADYIKIKQPTKPLTITQSITCRFSYPRIQEKNGFVTIQLNEATGYRSILDEPILPLFTKTLELPFGAIVKEIRYAVSLVPEIQLTQKIAPALQPLLPLFNNQNIQKSEDLNIFTKNKLFPDNWYMYRLTGGLNKNNILKTFLTIQVNPVRYNPIQNIIQSIDSITIDITYQRPSDSFSSSADTYDMIIICKDSYEPLLEPLVEHKDTHGIQTKIISLSDIYSETYFPLQGRDKQEQIKYFIKNAKEIWNITYVMLVGTFAQVPGRYSNLETDSGGTYEELNFASDLYYADIYNANGSFSSWDTDNDGIYAEWPFPEGHTMEDIVDLVPDVHVGRLACLFKSEVKTLVNKIITYETTTAGKEWFNRMIVVGGDTFNKSWEGGTDYNEGEIATGMALDYMSQFTPVKLWASLGNLTTENINNEINKGCGFLYFCGHGSPQMWATHMNGDYKTWIGGFRNTNIMKLTNLDMYPILMVGGCHNSEFDTALINFFKGLLEERLHYFSNNPEDFGSFWKYKWVPECWSWVFVKVRGGAIASIGSSGYGGVNIGDYNQDNIPDCIQGLDGWFEVEFFRVYNQENITILGQVYDQVLSAYIQNFPVDTYRYDAKIIETHVLLGDPSLKIGGY